MPQVLPIKCGHVDDKSIASPKPLALGYYQRARHLPVESYHYKDKVETSPTLHPQGGLGTHTENENLNDKMERR
jgi:hypothetical protein